MRRRASSSRIWAAISRLCSSESLVSAVSCIRVPLGSAQFLTYPHQGRLCKAHHGGAVPNKPEQDARGFDRSRGERTPGTAGGNQEGNTWALQFKNPLRPCHTAPNWLRWLAIRWP